VLQVDQLHCRYGKVAAVRDLSIEVRRGELVVLIGANGAGKTTTLKAISGLMTPAAGRILFEGEDVTGASARRMLALGIAHCPEGRRVFPYMTVRENLEMGCYLRSDQDAIEHDMTRLFERFPILRERSEQAAGTLSGGEQQMLAIARALMLKPRLMLLDEPSFGLAPLIVVEIFRILRLINKEEGVSILLVEQNAALALELADTAYVLETGRVVMSGPSSIVKNDENVRKSYLGY
jgi:branched-chain amino acid transport system ATP-binding protein